MRLSELRTAEKHKLTFGKRNQDIIPVLLDGEEIGRVYVTKKMIRRPGSKAMRNFYDVSVVEKYGGNPVNLYPTDMDHVKRFFIKRLRRFEIEV